MIQYVKRVFSVLILGTLIVVCDANSANMCIKDDVVAVVLDPLINGSSSSYVADTKSWSVSFSYGTISGIGGCYSNACGSLSAGCVATNQNISQYTSGQYCYCKTLRPVPSKWAYSGSGWSASSGPAQCNSNCASTCANSARSSNVVRRGMFGSIGQ